MMPLKECNEFQSDNETKLEPLITTMEQHLNLVISNFREIVIV